MDRTPRAALAGVRVAISRTTLRIASCLWLAAVIAGSLQPARPGIIAPAHRELHWLAFGGGAFLLFTLARTLLQEIVRAAAIFGFALLLEILQYSANRRYMEWRDVRDDSLAVLVALAIYRWTGAWKPPPGNDTG